MKLYKIFLPKKYNSGELIPTKIIMEIIEPIEEKFGAYSLSSATLPVISGAWTSETGRKYSEPMFLIELFVEDTFDNQKWLKSFKEIWRQSLKQEEFFVISQNAEVL